MTKRTDNPKGKPSIAHPESGSYRYHTLVAKQQQITHQHIKRSEMRTGEFKTC